MKRKSLRVYAMLLIVISFLMMSFTPYVSAYTNGSEDIITVSSKQGNIRVNNESICVVCEENTELPIFCAKHMVMAIFLVLVLIVNFIKFKKYIIKILINTAAVLILIIVFSTLYTTKMFTEAKVCLAILMVYLLLWVISMIKTVNNTEEYVNRSDREK